MKNAAILKHATRCVLIVSSIFFVQSVLDASPDMLMIPASLSQCSPDRAAHEDDAGPRIVSCGGFLE